MISPRVSVVIPLYNKCQSISRAIGSVLAQTESNFELIVIDDGSTDGSEGVVASIKDNRLRIISQRNSGQSAARNAGIRAAQTDWIAFLDADDEWMPHFLRTVLALTTRFPTAGAFATSYVACRNGKVYKYNHVGVENAIDGELLASYFRSSTLGASMVCSSAVLIPARIFREIGYFNIDACSGVDLDMWARIALRFPIAWSPIEAAVYHQSAENRHAGMEVEQDMPFAHLLEQSIQSGRYRASEALWMAEFLTRLRLVQAGVNMDYGAFGTARVLLLKTRATKCFRARWLSLAVRAYCPNRIGALLSRVIWAVAYRLKAKC